MILFDPDGISIILLLVKYGLNRLYTLRVCFDRARYYVPYNDDLAKIWQNKKSLVATLSRDVNQISAVLLQASKACEIWIKKITRSCFLKVVETF